MKTILFILLFFVASLAAPIIAGGPTPGDGGVQIVFGDDGAGGTSIVASGSGNTDDDVVQSQKFGVGYEVGDSDLFEAPAPAALDSVSSLLPSTIDLTDAFSVSLDGTTYTLGRLIAQPGRFFFNVGGALGSNQANQDFVSGGTLPLTVQDGTGTLPLDYSLFEAAHGMTFPTTDGYTFVFEPSPFSNVADSAEVCADKSQLKRKIKKLKKKLKKAKRAGNISGAKKLKKKLKKLKKKLKTLC